MMLLPVLIRVRLLAALLLVVQAWSPNTDRSKQPPPPPPRRTFIAQAIAAGCSMVPIAVVVVATTTTSSAAHALVKGNAPPLERKKPSERGTCTNVEECQQLAEEAAAAAQAEQGMFAVDDNNNDNDPSSMGMEPQQPVRVTKLGTRYKDMGSTTATTTATTTMTNAIAQPGDIVELYYKVLKLGKRSYDGLSGEGTVIFSRGYGLEDDEIAPRTSSFQTILGDNSVSNKNNTISALNDAVLGMSVGSIRRLAVTPEAGWRKPGQVCDGGPGGRGIGGTLKTDYIVVPTATMVASETCFDTSKQPFPKSYAQQRRMAQRFDQSLIMEVELVNIIRPSQHG